MNITKSLIKQLIREALGEWSQMPPADHRRERHGRTGVFGADELRDRGQAAAGDVGGALQKLGDAYSSFGAADPLEIASGRGAPRNRVVVVPWRGKEIEVKVEREPGMTDKEFSQKVAATIKRYRDVGYGDPQQTEE